MNKIYSVEYGANSMKVNYLTVKRYNRPEETYYTFPARPRAARMLRFFLAWLSRQPGAQLPRQERSIKDYGIMAFYPDQLDEPLNELCAVKHIDGHQVSEETWQRIHENIQAVAESVA